MKNDRPFPQKRKNDPEEWRSEENLRLRCQPCPRSRPRQGTDQVTGRLQTRPHFREWSWCFLLYLWTLKLEFHIIFMYDKILFFWFQKPLKQVTLLSSWAGQKEVAGHHRVLTFVQGHLTCCQSIKGQWQWQVCTDLSMQWQHHGKLPSSKTPSSCRCSTENSVTFLRLKVSI